MILYPKLYSAIIFQMLQFGQLRKVGLDTQPYGFSQRSGITCADLGLTTHPAGCIVSRGTQCIAAFLFKIFINFKLYDTTVFIFALAMHIASSWKLGPV